MTTRMSGAPSRTTAADIVRSTRPAASRAAVVVPGDLAVPPDWHLALAGAAGQGRAAAAAFATEHAPADAWMFRSSVVTVGGWAPGADVERGELAELHALQDSRTAAGIAEAGRLAQVGLASMWTTWLADHVAAADATRGQQLLTEALDVTNDVVQTVKGASMRQRPYVVDPTITAAVGLPGNNPSFPSGHASAAFAAAEVLASLVPDRRDELESMAEQVAFSRAYAGMHFRSDLLAGARVGAMVGAFLVRRGAAAPPPPVG